MIPAALDDERNRLLTLLRNSSVRTGDFILSSGVHSSYYIDARLTTMSGTGQALIGRLGLALLDSVGWHPSAIGGLTLGADPIAHAIAHAAALAGRPLDAFSVRKEFKNHGTGRTIEGPLRDQSDVVIVEDIVTTAESVLRAIAAVSRTRSRVLGVLALVDREQGGTKRLEQEGYPLVAMYRIAELIETGARA